MCRASRNNRLVALAGAIVSIPPTPAACCHLQPVKPLAANAASAASWQCAAVDAGWAIHSPQCDADGGAQPQDHSPGPRGGHLIAPPSPWRAHNGRGGGSDRCCSAVRPRAAGWAALLRGPRTQSPAQPQQPRQPGGARSRLHAAHLHHCRCIPASSIALVVSAGSPAHMGGMARIAACRAAC